MLIIEEQGLLHQVTFYDDEITESTLSTSINNCIMQLTEYFKGERKVFDLALNLKGTDFQKQVWDVVSNIPYGKTGSYMDIAKTLNNTGAIRAVGTANGKNNFHIVIPCHRVIGSDGSLTGYAGGIDKKKKLLELEGSWKDSQLKLFPS
jgi:methylated-DNA-[protein]-cysteine S-methyltransferase